MWNCKNKQGNSSSNNNAIKPKQGTKSRNGRAVRTLKLVNNDSTPFPPTSAQSQRQFGSDLFKEGREKEPSLWPRYSFCLTPAGAQTNWSLCLSWETGRGQEGKRVWVGEGTADWRENGIRGGVSWEKCQHGISDRAGLPETGAAWDGEGKGCCCGWEGGSTLLDQARRPEMYYTCNTSHWCMFPVGRGVVFNYSSESFIDSTQLIANNLWGLWQHASCVWAFRCLLKRYKPGHVESKGSLGQLEQTNGR